MSPIHFLHRFAVGPCNRVTVVGWAAIGLLLSMPGCGSFASRGMNAEGVRYFQMAQYNQAVREFQQAVNADPTNPDSYYNLAAAYHRVGKLGNRRADLDQAENLYNQCLDRDPQHSDCYRGLAVLLVEEGRSQEAFRLLEGWTSRFPTLPAARVQLAKLLEEFGDPQAARTQLAEALQLDPRNAQAHIAMGRIWEQLGAPEKAIVDYQRALAIDRNEPEVANRVAALRTSTGIGFQSTLMDDAEDRVVTRNAALRR